MSLRSISEVIASMKPGEVELTNCYSFKFTSGLFDALFD